MHSDQTRMFWWEARVYILPWCLWVWPTQGSKYICRHFCCCRGWLDKSLVNQCKWNNHRQRKWRHWERAWLWWYWQLVCRFLLYNELYWYQQWIIHGKDIILVIKNWHIFENRSVSYSLVIGLDELKKGIGSFGIVFLASFFKSWKLFRAFTDSIFVVN